MLLTFSDFMAFKEMFLDYRAVRFITAYFLSSISSFICLKVQILQYYNHRRGMRTWLTLIDPPPPTLEMDILQYPFFIYD